ncbi:MAG TPA: serine hydrolase [Bacteroidales bacterium]|nr:serine hydrolase [Bacteroidales bacterium]
MRKFLKFFLLTLLSLPVILVIVLSVKYSPRYVYRLIRYNVADVYDYKYFINRQIKPADSVFDFYRDPDEKYVESLFHDKVIAGGFGTLDEWAGASRTTALIFIRHDTILYEKYFNGFNRDSYFHSQSMAKSFISFLIGCAIDDGYISGVNDPMTKYIPELEKRDIRFRKITIRNLLMMRSGLRYNTDFIPVLNIHAPWNDEAVGYYHGNVRKLLLKRVKISAEPGKYFQYCNYNTSYLGLIIERATGMTVSKYLEKKLWSQIMEYEALFSVDSKRSGFEYMPSRLIARALDYARFGRLFLKDGNWNGKQIVSQEWVEKSTREDKSIPRKYYPVYMGTGVNRTYYKYQWWGHVNDDSTYQFFANGNLGQMIYVIPHEDIIIVHNGNSNALFGDNDLRHVADCIRFNAFQEAISKNGVGYAIAEFNARKERDTAYIPFNKRFLTDKGFSYLDADKTEDAISLFTLQKDTWPDYWRAYVNLGEAYQKSGDTLNAAIQFRKSLSLRPENNYAKEKLEVLE